MKERFHGSAEWIPPPLPDIAFLFTTIPPYKKVYPLFWGHIVQLRLFIYTERKEAGVQWGKGILDLQSVCGIHIPLATLFFSSSRTAVGWWCGVSGLSGLVSI